MHMERDSAAEVLSVTCILVAGDCNTDEDASIEAVEARKEVNKSRSVRGAKSGQHEY